MAAIIRSERNHVAEWMGRLGWTGPQLIARWLRPCPEELTLLLISLPVTRWAIAASVALPTLMPHAALAHAILEASSPRAGASVPAGIVALQLRYNSRIDSQRSRLILVRPDQTQTVLSIKADGSPEILTAQSDLPPGTYSVRWQVLAVDGHITRGSFSFSVVGR